MSRQYVSPLLAAVAAMALSTSASAQFFTDPLDDLSSWTVAAQPGSSAVIVDYGALGIPEAPNMVAGAATTGVQFESNQGPTAAGAAAVNLIGAISGGNADLALTEYQVDFDMWLSVGNPIPSGGTEQGIWGVGRTTLDAVGRNNRGTLGDGTWGWIATENGYFSEDSAIHGDTTELDDVGDTLDGPGKFNDAFADNGLGTFGDSPALQWVEVTLAVKNGKFSVSYNGLPFFFASGSPTVGDVMIGYEDPFGGSVSGDPANQYGIFDNVRIDDRVTAVVPEPTSVLLVGLGALGLVSRRRR